MHERLRNRLALTLGLATMIVLTPIPACAQDSRLVTSCEGGDLAACNNLGVDYDLAGRPAEAVQYFSKVCDGGLAIGCSNLAEFYYDGRGVQQDTRRALQLFTGARETDVGSGCAGFCVVALSDFDLGDDQVSMCRQVIQRACDGGNPWMCKQSPQMVATENGCHTGADALGNAFVRSNYMYSLYFGDLESYVAQNKSHFSEGGDAVRCARVLSQALLTNAYLTYDPKDLDRKREIDTRLGTMGISPGPTQPTMSGQLYAVGQQISWLADVLPAAARGDYGPLQRPTTQIQQMKAYAAQMLQLMLQDPEVRAVFGELEPEIRESADLEYRLVVGMAQNLGN